MATRKLEGRITCTTQDATSTRDLADMICRLVAAHLPLEGVKVTLGDNTMYGLTEAERKRKAELNEQLTAAQKAASEACNALNVLVEEANAWLTAVRSRLEDVWDRRSERWQDSTKGQALRAYIDEELDFEIEPAEVTVDETGLLDFPDGPKEDEEKDSDEDDGDDEPDDEGENNY